MEWLPFQYRKCNRFLLIFDFVARNILIRMKFQLNNGQRVISYFRFKMINIVNARSRNQMNGISLSHSKKSLTSCKKKLRINLCKCIIIANVVRIILQTRNKQKNVSPPSNRKPCCRVAVWFRFISSSPMPFAVTTSIITHRVYISITRFDWCLWASDIMNIMWLYETVASISAHINNALVFSLFRMQKSIIKWILENSISICKWFLINPFRERYQTNGT